MLHAVHCRKAASAVLNLQEPVIVKLLSRRTQTSIEMKQKMIKQQKEREEAQQAENETKTLLGLCDHEPVDRLLQMLLHQEWKRSDSCSRRTEEADAGDVLLVQANQKEEEGESLPATQFNKQI